jgi:hypothetical protein
VFYQRGGYTYRHLSQNYILMTKGIILPTR